MCFSTSLIIVSGAIIDMFAVWAVELSCIK
jgi:hypothetical protein